MLNLHNLTEEVANTQTERAGRMGKVRSSDSRPCPPDPLHPVWPGLAPSSSECCNPGSSKLDWKFMPAAVESGSSCGWMPHRSKGSVRQAALARLLEPLSS
jgi:hypothetical protein